jgi:Ser/Thr protein kinase RdoA (MazF antagonist)
MAYKNILPLNEYELIEWVAESYGLVVDGVDLRVGYMSTVAILSTSTQRFVLKCVVQKEDTQLALSRQITLATGLRNHFMPVADCVMGKGRQYFFEIDKKILSLWTFLVGSGFEIGNQKQLQVAGATLGKMHRVFAHEQGDKSGTTWGWSDRVAQMTHSWQAMATDNGQGKALVANLSKYLDKWVSPSEKEPQIMIHNDFRAQNLLFHGNEISGILDLDAVCISPRVWDVVYALAFFQAVIADRPLQVNEMAALLKGYHDHNPLDTNDLADLPQWLGLALLKGLTLWGQICYVDKVQPNVQKWLDGYLPLLEQVEVIGGVLQDGLIG